MGCRATARVVRHDGCSLSKVGGWVIRCLSILASVPSINLREEYETLRQIYGDPADSGAMRGASDCRSCGPYDYAVARGVVEKGESVTRTFSGKRTGRMVNDRPRRRGRQPKVEPLQLRVVRSLRRALRRGVGLHPSNRDRSGARERPRRQPCARRM